MHLTYRPIWARDGATARDAFAVDEMADCAHGVFLPRVDSEMGSACVPVAAGVIGDERVRAVLAARDMPAENRDHGLVLVGDVGDRRRQGEDHVIVRDRQQLGLSFGEPLLCRRPLALGAALGGTVQQCASLPRDPESQAIFGFDSVSHQKGPGARYGNVLRFLRLIKVMLGSRHPPSA